MRSSNLSELIHTLRRIRYRYHRPHHQRLRPRNIIAKSNNILKPDSWDPGRYEEAGESEHDHLPEYPFKVVEIYFECLREDDQWQEYWQKSFWGYLSEFLEWLHDVVVGLVHLEG